MSKCSTRVRLSPGAVSLASKPVSTAPLAAFIRASAARFTPLIAENVPPAYSREPRAASARTSPQLIFAVNALDPLAVQARAGSRPRWAAPLTVLNAPPA